MVIAMVERTRTRGMPSRVMMSRSVIESLMGMSGSADSQRVDRAGLLVGRLRSDADGITITVLDTVELPGVPLRAEPPGLLIALASNLHREAQAGHVGKEIVGWFHTHSGSGVAASDEDAIVHKSLSSLGAGVALIVDPVQHEASFFYMDGEALLPFPGYYMFDPVGESSSSGQPVPEPAAAQAPRRLRWLFGRRNDDTSLALRIASVALIVAIIALAAEIWTPRNPTEQLAAEPQPRLQSQLEPPIQPQAEPPAVPQPKPQAQQVQTAAQGNASKPTVKPGAPGTVTVTVAPGESVAVIAKRLYGRATDERMREILVMNGISDPRKISPGTTLVCPEPLALPAPPPGRPAAVTEPGAGPDADTGIDSGADFGVDPGDDPQT